MKTVGVAKFFDSGKMRSMKDHPYYKTWELCLTNLLGWSEEQVYSWAKQWEPQMNRTEDMFYHEEPTWYISYLLLPKTTIRHTDDLKNWLMAAEDISELLRGNLDNVDWSSLQAKCKVIADAFAVKLSCT